jgi:hypothetical protein
MDTREQDDYHYPQHDNWGREMRDKDPPTNPRYGSGMSWARKPMAGVPANDHGDDGQGYYRERTPGPTVFQQGLQARYIEMIRGQTAMHKDDLAEVKGIKPEQPRKYDSEDDIVEWEQWLSSVLSYFFIGRVVGRDHDQQRVLMTLQFLTGNASTWFNLEVLDPDRERRYWSFQDVILGLFNRFLSEITAHKVDAYEDTRY